METYTIWVRENPMLSAAFQFAILGTMGESIPHFIRRKQSSLPCNYRELLGMIAAWALLGIIIKYGFTGMKGFTRALLDHNMLPALMANGIGWAFAVSVLTNIFFGPQMMLFHRIEDNLILRQKNYGGLTKAWWTLVWFWIPAHTVTFSLPIEYQIGLAALWSVVLGMIMGFTKK